MTSAEAYELTTHGGASDFAHIVQACESFGSYCLIGGLAVNCYVEPVYTLDAEIVLIASALPEISKYLIERGFRVEQHPHSLDVFSSVSELRIRFNTDERYQAFLARAIENEILGVRTRVASIDDVTLGKRWAYSDPQRRLSKRKKDEADLIRLAESYPRLKMLYPVELRDLIDRG